MSRQIDVGAAGSPAAANKQSAYRSMAEWFISQVANLQASLLTGFTAELRAGGLGTAVFAMILGALHALTPGHGKSAIAAYFLGRQEALGQGVRVALMGAMLHVLNGFGLFLVTRFIIGASASITGRAPPSVTAIGYALIIAAGLLMLAQSLRPAFKGMSAGALTAGIGALPCPLTISVLGFAWAQASAGMLVLVLVSLALGIALTIGTVALAAIVARGTVGAALGTGFSGLETGARIAQGLAGTSIVMIGVYTLTHMQA
jgi:nickel/cobalt transporter (NicO) family protein